jgi:hypothetical protein
MTLDVKCSVSMHLFISSSVQSVFVSFCSTSWSDFAIVFLSCFMTHTPRDRKYALNFFWHVIVANLKSFSVHPANSVRNESHRSSSSSSFHSIIFASINRSASTKAEAILQGFSGLHESYAGWLAWIVCGVKCSDREAVLQVFSGLQRSYTG